MQVIYTIKYLFPNAKEVCLSNNNLTDRHTAEIISQMAEERDLLSKIQILTLTGSNEIGSRTMNALNKYVSETEQECALAHLNLIGC